jgi:hypothetical protein
MLIPVTRVTMSTGVVDRVLINTDWCVKIEPSHDESKPPTRVVTRPITTINSNPHVPPLFYVKETIVEIEALIAARLPESFR